MSYDIRFGVQTVKPNKDGEYFAIIGEPTLDSPTYNLGPMFRNCMNWDYKQGEWYPATEALEHIRHGIRELTVNRDEYIKYNPENGWGDLNGALRCLEDWEKELTDEFGQFWYWDIENVWFRW